MEVPSLQTIGRAKNLNRSDLARAAGVSRQAVSLWFRAAGQGDAVAIRSDHLAQLSHNLGVAPALLLGPLGGLTTEGRARLRAAFLWDSLYPDLDAFLIALADNEPKALARLVDRVGLFKAAKIAGDAVWTMFCSLKKYLRPQRAHELEQLWTLQQNLGLI